MNLYNYELNLNESDTLTRVERLWLPPLYLGEEVINQRKKKKEERKRRRRKKEERRKRERKERKEERKKERVVAGEKVFNS